MYNEEMLKSMKKLEETRSERKKQKLPLLSPEEKKELLTKFHPDYKPDTTRKMRVGANKGENVYHEYANLFEAFGSIDPGTFKLGGFDYDVDVLIIGGGGAGAAAALSAHSQGATVLLATKLRLGDANTMMAQGGIQAADKENDSPDRHYLDVIGGGGFHNDPDLVKALVMDAPLVISWLEKLGVMFDKEKDGTMVTIHGGGTSRKRMHSARDYSGGEIMKTLRDEVINRKIEVMEFSPAIELLTEKNRVTGAILYNLETEEYIIVSAKTTILATGGSGRLHIQGFPTTNHYGATADGLVLAYRAGAKMAFMDTVQYHPTGAAFPEQIVGLLITEKMRGLGAQLVNKNGDRFIYELETRDAEAAAIIRECEERNLGVRTPSGMLGVWLDSPLVEEIHGKGTIKKRLPAMYRQYQRFEIDMAEVPILVYPTQHYQNGGIAINDKAEAGIKNLYAAGETSGGVHGRNRLMGNSLLDILVFGIRAGKSAAEKSKKTKSGKLTLEHIKKYHAELKKARIKEVKHSPIILPDYRREETKARHVGIFEGGLA
ncbi:MAG: FAD-binding protein [Methanomassiliicoccales archaeon]|nr:MAG: FAD-binding protein [Methanomassiliicoccales archaeon]